MQTSSTRLKKPLHIWLARILGFGIVLAIIGTNLAALPEYGQNLRHQGYVQDVYAYEQPDGTHPVIFVSSEAAQKGIAIGDKILNPEAGTFGEVGTPVTLRFQRENLPVREVTFVRKPYNTTVLGGMLFGLSQETSTVLVLFFVLAPIILGAIAALLICWLKSDDWMALLTAILLTSMTAIPNTNPYVVIFDVLLTPLIVAWLILFPNGKLAPRWSWVLIFFLLPSQLFYALLDLGILSYDTPYPGVTLLVSVLTALGGLGIMGVIVFRYWRVFSPSERQQSKWVILPLVVGLVPSIILSLVSTLYRNSSQFETSYMIDFVNAGILTVVISILFVLGVLFSIFSYRLYDVDTVISRAIVYSSLTGILTLVGLIVIPIINYVLKQSLGSQSGMLAVLVSAVPMVTLFNPVRERLQQVVERRFKPEEMDFDNTFIEFTSELRSLFTVKELSTQLARHAVEQLDIAYASVFLNGQDGHLKHITTISPDQETAEPSLDDKIMEKLRTGQLTSPDGDYAQSLVIPLVVPRSRKPSLLGALVLGPRSQGVGYSTPMVKSLKKFGEEVGKAFYVAEMKSNQKRILMETE